MENGFSPGIGGAGFGCGLTLASGRGGDELSEVLGLSPLRVALFSRGVGPTGDGGIDAGRIWVCSDRRPVGAGVGESSGGGGAIPGGFAGS